MSDKPVKRAPKTRRRSRLALSPEERAERLAAARQQLLEGVDKLLTSEGWEQLITSRAWLRRYSLANLIMILQQCPNATDVRPLSEWKERGFGYMRKGTHKIKIWKPCFRKAESPEGERNQADEPDEMTSESRLSGFMLVPVVDVSQLQGDPRATRPNPPAPVVLAGDAPTGLWDGIAGQIAACGYRLERGDCSPAYGETSYAERTVTVRGDLEPAQAAKTLTHELAHILCEHESRRTTTPRSLREVEAESVACIVGAVCGLDTLDYSVPYVANWAGDRDVAHLSAARVLKVADAILDRLERLPRNSQPADRAAQQVDLDRGVPLLSVRG
jgi:hypothetical protein